jgi:hypothetical protein
LNSTLCISTDATLNNYGVQAVEDGYETAPIALTKIACQPLDEEELHLSFEEAIDSRVTTWHEQLSRIANTDSLIDASFPCTNGSNVLLHQVNQGASRSPLGSGWQRGVIFCGLAFIFTLIGFNLMGLLILSTR